MRVSDLAKVLGSIVALAAPAAACGGASSTSVDGGTASGGEGGTGVGGDADDGGPRGCFNDPNWVSPRKTEVRPYVPVCIGLGDASADDGGDAGCIEDPTPDCGHTCGRDGTPQMGWVFYSCRMLGGDGAPREAECTYTQICGRRYERLPASSSRRGDAVGRLLADAAYLEDAAVTAFEILARDLAAHDAPARLVASARRAARDEIRHARSMARLARARGVVAKRAPATRYARRGLERIAIENATEGCVRETYGALVATHQAVHARDPEIRAAMAAIARDETRHAALSWEIDAWVTARLRPAARRRVERARARALRELAIELGAAPDTRAVEDAGLPSARRAVGMLRCLADSLRLA